MFTWKQNFFICEENFLTYEIFFINNVSFCYCCGSYWPPCNTVVPLLTINKSLFFELYRCLYSHCQTSTKNMFKFKSIHHTPSHTSGILQYNNVMASSYNRNSGLIISINRCAIFNFKTTQSNLKNHLNYMFSQLQYRRKMVKMCNRYICIRRELNFSFSFIFQVITLPVQFDDQNVGIYGGDGKCNVDFTKVQSWCIMESQKQSPLQTRFRCTENHRGYQL